MARLIAAVRAGGGVVQGSSSAVSSVLSQSRAEPELCLGAGTGLRSQVPNVNASRGRNKARICCLQILRLNGTKLVNSAIKTE